MSTQQPEMSLATATQIATGIIERSQIHGYTIVSESDRRQLVGDIGVELRVAWSQGYQTGKYERKP